MRSSRFSLDLKATAAVTAPDAEAASRVASPHSSETAGPGDVVLVPDPAYPIHQYSVIIAGADLRKVPLNHESDFIENLEQAVGSAAGGILFQAMVHLDNFWVESGLSIEVHHRLQEEKKRESISFQIILNVLDKLEYGATELDPPRAL